MSPQARRRLIPLLVMLSAAGIVLTVLFGPARKNVTSNVSSESLIAATTNEVSNAEPEEIPTNELGTESSSQADLKVLNPTETLVTGQLSLRKVNQVGQKAVSLGALNEIEKWQLQATLTSAGAGIESIRFSNIFETVDGKLAWTRYREVGGIKPLEDDLYLLGTAKTVQYQTPSGIKEAKVSILGASQIFINNQSLYLTSPEFWTLAAQDANNSATFEAYVIDASENKIATIRRKWTLDNKFSLVLEQTVTNHTADALKIRWIQYGPQSLIVDRSRYMDRRRFRFGWELSDEFDPNQAAQIQATDILFEYADAAKLESEPLWPSEEAVSEEFKLSWFASTNRYFALAVYPNIIGANNENRAFVDTVASIRSQTYSNNGEEYILTSLWSPEIIVPEGALCDFSMGIYAGPMTRTILDSDQPYAALNMRELVLYQMSSMCAFCTFQWLADLLAWILTFLDKNVVFDWGFAIIFLVLIVRGLLHPITKKSQINMQRFGKVMQKIKPEIEKLKEKYPNDAKRVQSEQMKLMQKYGVNPFQMLGCLPMFLQMPVWVALYALLYFMFDIRQEPAFFGVFQLFWEWPFLADLSASDHFFGEFDQPINFFFWNITGINVLPILMGAIFFVQQKYMSPQNMATTPEQESQQKIMRIMMVVMFPLMLYSAPSGLTLYILTSSTVGILESQRIRKHVENIDVNPRPEQQDSQRRKPKDKQGRAWADAMEARRKKVQNKAKKRNFKKRN